MKFKVGDRVKVIKCDCSSQDCIGKISIIISKSCYTNKAWKLADESICPYFYENELELITNFSSTEGIKNTMSTLFEGLLDAISPTIKRLKKYALNNEGSLTDSGINLMFKTLYLHDKTFKEQFDSELKKLEKAEKK